MNIVDDFSVLASLGSRVIANSEKCGFAKCSEVNKVR